MNKEKENAIECPFYIDENFTSITCEGIINNTVTVQKFKTNSDIKKYQKKFCSVYGGRRCPHYRNVMLLYDRGLR